MPTGILQYHREIMIMCHDRANAAFFSRLAKIDRIYQHILERTGGDLTLFNSDRPKTGSEVVEKAIIQNEQKNIKKVRIALEPIIKEYYTQCAKEEGNDIGDVENLEVEWKPYEFNIESYRRSFAIAEEVAGNPFTAEHPDKEKEKKVQQYLDQNWRKILKETRENEAIFWSEYFLNPGKPVKKRSTRDDIVGGEF